MSGISARTISDMNIQNGRESWKSSLIWDDSSKDAKIDAFIIERVVRARFGTGNYELKSFGAYWQLIAPSTLTQVSSCLDESRTVSICS